MNFTIRRGPLPSWAALISLTAILVSSACFAQADDGGLDILPVLGDSFSGGNNELVFQTQGLTVTGFNSRPLAPYTIYLDFGGFAFSGSWATSGKSPGTTPAYDLNGDASTFTSGELDNIKIMWSRVAEKYSAFNINVTTVDPAVAAGQASTDTQRQNFYDNTPKLMHTIIGGTGSWYGSGGGVSYVGKTAFSQTGSNGFHTDFVFAAQAPTNLQAISEATAHENGHGLGLNHQSDPSHEYNEGTGLGPGSKAPIMGKSYSSERGLWKIGSTSAGGTQNDLLQMMNSSTNPGLAPFINDGIGHTRATATLLPLVGQNIDYNAAKGVIVPAISNPVTTTGAATYQSDYWSFTSTGDLMRLSVISGRESITPGLPDPGATLDASLEILDSLGAVLYTSATANSLSESLFFQLPAGDYFAHIMSAADPTASSYYDIGSYFLTGTLSVPEPSTIVLLIFAATQFTAIRRRRNK